MRHHLVYTVSSLKSLQQISESDQILVTKPGSSRTDLDEWIDASSIGATRQNRLQPAFGIVEVHAILTPVVPIFHQVKLLSR